LGDPVSAKRHVRIRTEPARNFRRESHQGDTLPNMPSARIVKAKAFTAGEEANVPQPARQDEHRIAVLLAHVFAQSSLPHSKLR
jgi:hypothetical protein